jgi:D-alanine-D-alanine ligase
LFDTGKRGLDELAKQAFDRVFIALHGRYGEDGTMQGALELLGIPYTGSGPLAASLAMDKIMTKRVCQQAGLPTPNYRVIETPADLNGLIDQLGLPLILKAPNEGSTLGLYKVTEAAELAGAYAQALAFDEQILAEQFVEGRELTVAILGRGSSARALPTIEIVAPGGNYDYEHKYFSDDTQYLCPAPLTPSVNQHVQQLAVQAYRLLGCEGWARADFMLDKDERPWLLEINTSPGMTGHSLVPMAAKAAGMDYATLCVSILTDARCKVGRQAMAQQDKE